MKQHPLVWRSNYDPRCYKHLRVVVREFNVGRSPRGAMLSKETGTPTNAASWETCHVKVRANLMGQFGEAMDEMLDWSIAGSFVLKPKYLHRLSRQR